MRLKGKVAIITGSSRGIGKAIAIDFAREGASIVVAARSDAQGRLPGTIHETVEDLKKFGAKALAVKCDVSNEKDVEACVQLSLQRFDKIDILVNNAAVGYYKKLVDTPLKHWDLVMKVNVRGPFICIKAVLPSMMKQKGGSIINISSSAAQDIYSRVKRQDNIRRFTGCAYGSSKAALERLTLGLAEEVKEYNISVNALKPVLPTFSEGVAFWNPDINESDFVSAHTYMTKAAIFLASQNASGLSGRLCYDKELCDELNLT